MKSIAIIGTVGLPSKYGGFETLAEHLVENLSEEYNITVYCSKQAYKKSERLKTYKGAKLVYIPFKANGFQSCIYDALSILHAIFFSKNLIILGVSGGLVIPFVRLFTNRKVVVNIDGLEWRREKWGRFAKLFLRISEKVAVRWSNADVTDNESIKRYTSKYYKTLSHQIEYGADHTRKVIPTKEDYKKYPFLCKPYVFKVARIEPENNIEMILLAFKCSTRELVLVGNWNNSEFGKRMKKEYGKCSNINLLDPIYDQNSLDVLRSNCSLYVHGHGAGGTNPSLVEAMYLELPIIAFDCSFNKSTTENEAMYFKSADELLYILESVKLVYLKSISVKMKRIADRRYTWGIIANKYAKIIEGFSYKYKKHRLWSKLSKLKSKELISNEVAHLKQSKYYYENIND